MADASSLDGAITTAYLPTVDHPDDPWVKLFQKVWDASGQSGAMSNYHIYGMSQAYTMVQALQAAGENPTRDSLVNAVEQAGGDWQGPNLAPYRFSEDSHMGISGMSVVQIKGTSTEELEPVQTTDLGDADIKPYDGKESTPPDSGIPDEDPVD